MAEARATGMGSYATDHVTVGYALTPGHETCRGLGWCGAITQREPEAASVASRAA
ncbi:MAG: hypothetical protein Q8N10_20860 [Phenylobacterium sp.]|uniref:hypothetical protein n=1 Tax=Phenylobacterium sp. TaxID=1871053 RepID=UPI00272409F8|nr:hypothetical protein [Phenylobacterium sp.]MDO8911937.1 hypothetical protein [Phenylobacterium sp.]MDP3102945.1 hypothetical protein [Phenylobacterium sp.]MDP3633861.1 hypothetical protein [Phenylobacterium sp.]MDP3866896.1 hypothetical protein [Phenylobacterium sp.]